MSLRVNRPFPKWCRQPPPSGPPASGLHSAGESVGWGPRGPCQPPYPSVGGACSPAQPPSQSPECPHCRVLSGPRSAFCLALLPSSSMATGEDAPGSSPRERPLSPPPARGEPASQSLAGPAWPRPEMNLPGGSPGSFPSFLPPSFFFWRGKEVILFSIYLFFLVFYRSVVSGQC